MLTIATLYPELLGTYGDAGNALVLASRAKRRGINVDRVDVALDEVVPRADLFLIGGGEDGPQRQATRALRESAEFANAVASGAVVLAVCAGLQILGTTYEVDGGDVVEGVGLLPVSTTRGAERRVGDLVARVGEQQLVGFENHGGETHLDDGVDPLGRVILGHGNDGHHDGVRYGNIFGTYAHGPVCALNPWFADLLLESAVGHTLTPLAGVADELHAERLHRLID